MPCHVLRSYCNTDLHPEHRHLSQLEAIKLYLKGKEPLLQCECASKCVLWVHVVVGSELKTITQFSREALFWQRLSVTLNPAKCLHPIGTREKVWVMKSHAESPIPY